MVRELLNTEVLLGSVSSIQSHVSLQGHITHGNIPNANLSVMYLLGIDGLGGTKLIFGTTAARRKVRAGKGGKVNSQNSHLIFSHRISFFEKCIITNIPLLIGNVAT